MFRRLSATAVLIGLAIFATASSAFAYWTVYGRGASTATVATVEPLVIEVANVKDMVIGVSVPLAGEVQNPNDFEASLLGTRFTMVMSIDRRHHGCAPENFKVVSPTTTAKTIPAKGVVPFDGGSIMLVDTGKNQIQCQGAVVTLDYSVK